MEYFLEEGSAISESCFEEKILKELEEFSDDENLSCNNSYGSIRAVNRNISNF